MDAINKLEQLIKSNMNISLPNIRYFDGPEMFSTPCNKYKYKTLIGALELFLNEKTSNTSAILPNNTKWPTFEGRLNNPLTSELEALEQLQKSVPLTKSGQKRLNKLKNKK